MSESPREDDLTFPQQERRRVHERRAKAFPDLTPPSEDTQPEDVVGLSLSGGGLRSAMFNDGFLQGLSHCGLLRYVDYLCSVSGGGYTAGHLATRANKDSKHCFHDETGADDETERWALGRDPITGKVNSNRLAGVGRYLASKIAIAPSFLWSFFQSACVLFGITGVVATLLALFWRSFDDPMFRVLLHNVLDFRFGDELAIAFYPALLVLIGWIFVSALGWFRGASNQLAINRIGLTAFLVSVGISFAVFLGNGKTNIRAGDGDSMLQLNHYAQWLAIVAGALQVAAFLARDTLFRSERDEAKNWQKAVQAIASSGVVVFAGFAMVHWMARENISEYTYQRSKSLVRGDVQDWDLLQRLSASFEIWQAQQKLAAGEELSAKEKSDLQKLLAAGATLQPQPSTVKKTAVSVGPDNSIRVRPEAPATSKIVDHAPKLKPVENLAIPADFAESEINLTDEWEQHQLVHPLIPMRSGLITFTESEPPRPIINPQRDPSQAWTFWERIGGVVLAYTRWTPDQQRWEDADEDFKKDGLSIRKFQLMALKRWYQQEQFLGTREEPGFNAKLQSPEFTQFLIVLSQSDAKNADRDLSKDANSIVRKLQLDRLQQSSGKNRRGML